ncbi:MAG TPA: FtsX-like permease family protein, partial [Chryseolinea sp.]|nr:FtsX-like permease family protein [Chryseolinea sp.]
PLGPALKESFPEVEQQVRIHKQGTQVKVGADQFSETVTFGGQHFFDVFDFPLVNGSLDALKSQNGVVINRYTSQKYFGTINSIGKTISIQLGERFEDFEVKAVVETLPSNSSIRFYLLISDLNYPKLYNEQTLNSEWFNVTPETFVLLREGVHPNTVVQKFPSMLKTAMGEEAFTNSKYTAGLQPLTAVHLDTAFPTGLAEVNDPKYSYILAAIAILILAVACINFVTLSVGRSIKRAKEVGIRKVVGAERLQLIFQFIGEALIVTMISLAVGVVVSVLALPLFNDLSGKKLLFEPNGFSVFMAVLLVIIIGLVAGSYPAFVLSNFKPIAILKGKLVSGNSKQGLRKVLVGVQLMLSIFLISSTLVMRKQLSFLQNKNLGYDKEQLMVVQLNVPRGGRLVERVRTGFEKAEQFKAELSKTPEVISVGASSHDFGYGGWTNIGYTDDNGTYRTFNLNIVDYDYMQTLKMEFAAGRNFSKESPTDYKRGVIVNESLLKEYGWSDAVGKGLPGKNFGDHEVIGVVRDFNYESLYTKVTPLVIVMDPAIILQGAQNVNIGYTPVPKLMIRLHPGNLTTSIEKVKEVWNRLTGDEEFVFDFVDQALAEQYRNDMNLGKIVQIATLLAMTIGSLGLYALASLAMQNRVKEISIRKVMGASENSLFVLLSKDYVALIAVSLLLSVPITFYLMKSWLQSFEYRVDVGWEVFIVAGAISLLIALATISYHTIRTALSRPAETLKYE